MPRFRRFVTDLLATRGVTPGDRDTPPVVARLAAPALEGIWKFVSPRRCPARDAIGSLAQACTIDISKTRLALGYQPVKTREQGLAKRQAVWHASSLSRRSLHGMQSECSRAGIGHLNPF